MASKRTLVVVMLTLAAGAVWADVAPETVSPGTAGRVARISRACPSFSWGAVEDSISYELVVYGLGGTDEASRPVLSVRIPGSALSWTPSLSQCLAPGGRYVWFVRSEGRETVGEWSDGRMFEIAEGPTITEVEQAVRVLERFTEEGGEGSEGGEVAEESLEANAGPASEIGTRPEDPAAPGIGVEIAESSITIGGMEVVTTATDADTLGGMSCADGQVAKWNAGLSQWQCGDDGGGTSYSAGNQLTLNGSTFNVVEGPGSGLDADTLDGAHAGGFLAAGTDNWVDTAGDTMTGTLETVDVDLGGVVEKDGATLLWADSSDNTALGKRALSMSTIGRRSTAIGAGALENEEGIAFYYSMNTAVGADAMRDTTTGFYNTAVGADALRSNTEGYWNTGVGKEALLLNTTGYSNSSVGAFSLFYNSEGSKNTAIGEAALWGNTTGDSNTAAGQRALFSNAAGLRNSAFGARSLEANQGDNPGTPTIAEGSDNSALGFEALFSNTTGLENTAVGAGALRANTTGIYNTAVGAGALDASSGASSNTAVGTGALAGALGSSNVGIGREAGSSLGAGSFNIMIGNAGDSADDHTIRIGDSNSWETYIAGIRNSMLVGGSPLPVAVDTQGRLGTAAFGGGSGLDADLLDGLSSGAFLRSNASDAFTAGTLTFDAGTVLDVSGTLNLTGSAAVNLPANKIYGAGSGSGLDADMLDGLDSSAWVETIGDTMTGTLILSPGAGNALVATVGNVGIGTATPDELLEIESATGSPFLTIDRGSNQLSGIRWKETGSQQWIFPFVRGWQNDNLIVRDEMSSTDVMTFQSNTGYVGIGTPSPGASLDVQGAGSEAGGVAGFEEVMARFKQTVPAKHSAIVVDALASQDPIIYLSENGQPRWGIRAKAGPTTNFEVRLHEGGSNRVAMAIEAPYGTDPDFDFRFGGDVFPGQDDSFSLGISQRRWKEVWAANALIQTSDVRLKELIVPIAHGLDEVLLLRPVSFAWRDSDDSRTHLGLIAQEVEPLVPEAVRRGENPDDAWAMTYSSLTPVLIKAIQDQQAIIEELRARVEALEDGS